MSIASILRQTTEEMANRASVPMDVWDRHSNAALQAADRIEALESENAQLKDALCIAEWNGSPPKPTPGTVAELLRRGPVQP